ncbi:hypothetical protein ARALYDRAFT_491986 [Arabidopsis lyrata subsp. lyrata]|uniref:Uncharacterized protein n=1 Tax=Arabidopsis lyrata subsp. lyrata TaxID=81972 RepID=D7MDP8_ARALL|nr:hypothetical protein ARALYDRAFT_491986 [Arabidopsis lyrata subsp. lyrata]
MGFIELSRLYFQGIQKFYLHNTDLKQERRRTKMLRRLVLNFSSGGVFCCLSMTKVEREYETILKKTLQNICVLTVVTNTATSVIIQVVHDGGYVSSLCSLHLGKHLLMLSETHIIRYKQCLFEYL